MDKQGTSRRVADGVSLLVETYEEVNANVLQMTIGTNTPCGGDGGHGGRTLFELRDGGATGMEIETDGSSRVTIVFSGDAEAQTLLAALRQAAEVMERQISANVGARRRD